MNNENERNYTAPNYEGPMEAIEKRLEDLVAQKIANPNSLLAMLEFKQFIDGLPYGKVTFETIGFDRNGNGSRPGNSIYLTELCY